jgi:uncharacterized oligopeptide transporter (OPT) family protein
LIGGLIAHFYSKGQPEAKQEATLHRGVLFSSGVIAGEALTAVGLAGLAAWGIKALDFGLDPTLVTALSCFAAIAIVIAFVIFTKPAKK